MTPGVDPLWGQAAAEVGAASVRRADAIVNPKFQPPDDPLRTLPGVGVAYKLIQQLYADMGRAGEERELLDLVALGIVADVAEQVHDARYLLQRGLEQLRNTERIGLLALMDVAGVDAGQGRRREHRLPTRPAHERAGAARKMPPWPSNCSRRATRCAPAHWPPRMKRLNQERRLHHQPDNGGGAGHDRRAIPSCCDFNGLVLAHPAWHAGIVGIVASRLVEEFGKPTVLLLTPPGENARGSARSIPGVDIGAVHRRV